MKHTRNLLTLILLLGNIAFLNAQGLVAYYKVGTINKPITEVANKAKSSLIENQFQIIGEYKPANDTAMYVIAFTRKDLQDIAYQIPDRGALACVLRIGLVTNEKKGIDVILLNPDYLFLGYLGEYSIKYQIELAQISEDVRIALASVATEFAPLITSSLSEKELREYKFMVDDPGFDQPIVINQFASFNEGLNKIRSNLKARKNQTIKVYEIVDPAKEIAVFGVGLWDKERGEAQFLNQLGNSHLPAMPYEIILIGKEASILHGKFRFPFYWSDLTMASYRKIYRTPRDIEEIMKNLAN